jgi:hypothetical protein
MAFETLNFELRKARSILRQPIQNSKFKIQNWLTPSKVPQGRILVENAIIHINTKKQ